MDRLLIIDSSNFIGFEIKKRFRNEFEIFSFTGDITDPFHVERCLLSIKPDYIIHLCQQHGLLNLHERDNLGLKTYQGTLNVLNAVRKIPDFKLLFFHSIYDKNETVYDLSKLSAEKIIETSGVPYCVLKLPYVYGDFFRHCIFNIGQHIDDHVSISSNETNFKLEKIIFEIKNHRSITIDSDKWFRYIVVDDVVNLYNLILKHIGDHTNKKYTVPWKDTVSISQMVKELEILMNGWAITVNIEESIEWVENVVPTYDVLDWQPNLNFNLGTKILLQKMSIFEKDIYGF